LNPKHETDGFVVSTKLSKNPFHNNSRQVERHVVLVAPEIHWNTGNIGRTCLATDADLHLIRPLGFSIESRQVKRAGLDYWDNVRLTVWDNFDDFLANTAPRKDEVAVFSKSGSKSFWTMICPRRLFLIFGSETRGLSDSILHKFSDATYHIPITSEIRSLNLSTAAGIALYESLRAAEPFHDWP
jgi:tRNA (cytidine/uridine-2'-O-)-methyltransferase